LGELFLEIDFNELQGLLILEGGYILDQIDDVVLDHPAVGHIRYLGLDIKVNLVVGK